MARTKTTDDSTDTPVPAPTDNALVEALARLVSASEDGPIKQVSIAKATYRTPWYTKGPNDTRPKFARKTRINGFLLRERTHSNEEIQLCNQLKPGKYNNRRWFVTLTEGDEGTALDIYLPNKTQSDRLVLAQTAPDLVQALKLMINEGSRASA